ncbi:alpha-L-fucosidase [uncultured Dysgonomonas sp.]|uniref:alpha-L-fucosidase n=1 Tax=uncultured Dysgonomonas sp. TaxID=206096 RepID=A0A212JUI4_9BACT|nr:alpha-L-fucosidase [uncultured Dysgonomonas sp.]SBW03100.1 conserved exported hypothetical protein [uncultured Dysgonomonas sp.]
MKKKTGLMSIMLVLITLFSCKTEVKEPTAYGALPTEQQLKWQELEYYMFIHFGPNTFTDVEWGDGKESPEVFNPTNLNTDQWAATAKAAGMKAIIITAKHHDGFCLWPSEYSTHTVRESKWKDGKGDILKDLAESCKKYGLLLGVYLSPWDQNHPAYNTPEYNQIFANTLNEVHSNYGDIFEQWFDGANDGTSKQVYDWDLFHKTVFEKHPHAIIFSDVGPGCRWVGNERGYAGETNWSMINAEGYTPGANAPDIKTLNEGLPDGKDWIPAEVDVSIRPGWFYSPATDDKVKSVSHLMDIYYSSVGRNGNLLLNVPPDRRGQIHANDSIRLMEFKEAREKALKINLAKDVKATASNTRGNSDKYSTSNLFDGDKSTYWATDDGIKTASIEVDFGKTVVFNRILLQEYIALGQRIAEFDVKYWNDKEQIWNDLTSATTIGYKRILCTPQVSSSKIKIDISKSLAEPLLNNLEVYNAPENISSIAEGEKQTSRKDVKFVIKPSKDIVTTKKKDGTILYTEKKEKPIIIEMDRESLIRGLKFTPDISGQKGTIQRYNCYYSFNGMEWKTVITNGIFNNIKNNPMTQEVLFPTAVRAKFIKIEPIVLTESNDDGYTYCTIDVIL